MGAEIVFFLFCEPERLMVLDMPNQQDKLSSFIRSIMSDVKKESQEITEQCQGVRESAVAEASDQYLAEAYAFIRARIAELQMASGQAISKKALENNREIFQYRQDMKTRILSDVQAKIAAFTDTAEYEKALFKTVEALFEKASGRALRLYLRESDLHFAQPLKAAFTGLLVAEASEGIALGGVIAESADGRVRFDASFDTAFLDINERFFELISVL